MKQGKLTQWNGAKGFGFIQGDDGERVFVHISTLKRGGLHRPKPGDVVFFEAGTDAKGRVQAIQALASQGGAKSPRAANSRKKSDASSRQGARDMIDYLLMGLLPLLLLMVLSSPARVLLLALIAISSVLVFALYWLDKSQAEKQGRRVAEAQLNLLSLVGGWPGAWFAQQRLRHKTQKTSFRVIFFACAILNVVLLGYLLTQPQILSALGAT